MQRKFRRRVLLLAVPAAAAAAALAVASGALDVMIMSCPSVVIAGNPITGYVEGGAIPMTVTERNHGVEYPDASYWDDNFDPNFFCFPTTEQMAGLNVTVMATAADGETIAKTVHIQ